MFDFLFGSAQKRSLEQRVISMASLLVLLVGILATIQNLLVDIPPIHNVFSGLATVAGVFFYWLSRTSQNMKSVAIGMTSFFLLMLIAAWFPTNGTYGSITYFFMMTLLFGVIVLPSKWRMLFGMVFVLLITGMAFFEFHNKQFLTSYTGEASRYIDVVIAYLVSSVATGALVYLVVEEYRNERKRHAKHLAETLENKRELEQALAEIRTLKGFLPICASCKKIRNDNGYWEEVATYISHHTEAQFSHGICPDCCETLYPGMAESTEEKV